MKKPKFTPQFVGWMSALAIVLAACGAAPAVTPTTAPAAPATNVPAPTSAPVNTSVATNAPLPTVIVAAATTAPIATATTAAAVAPTTVPATSVPTRVPTTAPTIVPTVRPATPLPAPTSAPAPLATATTTGHSGHTGETKAVDIRLFQFQPNVIEVKAGTTIVWTNRDLIEHSVTQGKDGKSGGVFDSGFFTLSKTYSSVFNQPGEYTYFCARHNSMTGVVKVVP